MQTTLENNICPLPPIKECAFLSFELDELHTLVSDRREHPYKVSVLHHRYSAVMLQTKNLFSHAVGAENSRHSRSSLLICQKNDSEDVALAKVRFFAKCNARNDHGEKLSCCSFLVYVPPLPCVVW